MHELAVTQGILQVALTTASQHQARRIRAIELVIGDLSSIVDDSVQFYFDILSRDTPAAGAHLRFRREAAILACWDCAQQTAVTPPLPDACPHCRGTHVQVSGGAAFQIASIDVDDVDDVDHA